MAVVDFESARQEREAAVRSLAPQEPLRKDGGGGIFTDMATGLEQRVTRIEGAAVAAFVFLIVTFGGGYVLLSNQISSGFERVGDKVDAVSSQVAEVSERTARLEGAADKAP